jgi:branched-chain amino acid transport system substrate-binding protein
MDDETSTRIRPAIEPMPNELKLTVLVSAEKAASFFDLRFTREPVQLAPGLTFPGEIERTHRFEEAPPIGGIETPAGERDDDLRDDSAIVFQAAEGLVVITGCAHAGICNTLSHASSVCGETRIHDVIGGFHLLDPPQRRLDETTAYFQKRAPRTVHACHCSDLRSKIALSRVADDQCKTEIAVNVATKLVANGADIVLGHICSGPCKAAMGIYMEQGIIAMSPSATNTDLTKSGQYPNFFRTIAPDDAQARTQIDFALKVLNAKKIAIVHDKGDYGKGLAEFAKGFLEKEAPERLVLFEGITPGAVDYTAIINKIKRADADVLIYGGFHPEASKLVQQMRKKRMDTLMISDDGVKDETFIKVAGEFAEGVYATGPMDTTSNPMAIAAIEEHRQAYGEDPGAFFLNAYAAAMALLNGIEKAGSTDFQAFRQALRTNAVDTPLGRIRFNEQGDAIGVGFAVFQVRNGFYEEVK